MRVFGVVGFRVREGCCGDFRRVGCGFFAVGVGGFFVNYFEEAGVVAVYEEIEFVRGVAVGERAGAFDGAGGGVAVPCVDVVHGVVCHE